MDVQTVIDDIDAGHRLDAKDALSIARLRGREVWTAARVADRRREAVVGDRVTFVCNQNLHITNICVNLCGFCGFGRRAEDPGAYCDDEETVRAKARLARERGVTEICLLSGVHPDLTLDRMAELITWVREEAPATDIHAASPDEVAYVAERGGYTVAETLERLREAGLGTMQGTAAEILVDEVRRRICPEKIDTATWVEIITTAHRMGIRTTATIMYGSGESWEDRIRHLEILREIQDRTGGFLELVPLSYLHQNTALYERGLAPAGATGREDLLLHALARLFLDNMDHIQASWGKLGPKLAQICLCAGADDLGGTMYADDVSRDAGARDADFLSPGEMRRIASDIGRTPRQRTTDYRLL
ncbi:MAG: 5-amino-6-(D-ribitylamino)uracil--L-tyrosine 4-hydroxyphenyl transferase CofH [Methanomicrobiales archaeon]